MNKEKILLIVEGDKTEPKIMKQYAKVLNKTFDIEIVSFGTNIYTLYKKIKSLNEDFFGDDSTSTLEALTDIFQEEFDVLQKRKEELSKNGIQDKYIKKEITKIKKKLELLDENYPYIYLLFDVEYQDNTNKNKFNTLTEMFEYFNDETDNGLLLVNYPMIESFKDYKKPAPDDSYSDKLIAIEDIRLYKEIVGKRGNIENVAAFKLNEFEGIVFQNIKKLNLIINGKYEVMNYNDFIKSIYDIELLKKQYKKIEESRSLYILCCAIFVYAIFLKKEYYNGIINTYSNNCV